MKRLSLATLGEAFHGRFDSATKQSSCSIIMPESMLPGCRYYTLLSMYLCTGILVQSPRHTPQAQRPC